MKKSCKIAFVSNYINHHQIPFCDSMYRLLEGAFVFVQTEGMEQERVQMGWHASRRPDYVRCWYEEPEACRRLVLDCDVALFGGTDDESYIEERLRAGKPVMRVSERLYKTGQWKAVSPRGLLKKYHDHTRYRKSPVWLLCAGAYVASDFRIIRAYPGKMYCWGYFPETRRYDLDTLFSGKGYGEERIPYLLWAARMIDWKHPELALETARYLKEKNLVFHMDIIGDGELRSKAETLAQAYGLEEYVTFLGYQPPESVRSFMEKANIFLFTSDRQEGWGAVANEAMNSGCALVADHMIGAVPFLVRNGENGFIYEDGKKEQLFALAEKLVEDRALCRDLGKEAYKTISQVWNGENAAGELLKLIGNILGDGKEGTAWRNKQGGGEGKFIKGKMAGAGEKFRPAPCLPAPVLSERRARRLAD